MSKYDVILKFEINSEISPTSAAEKVFEEHFKESLWQPAVFEVIDITTGESQEIDVCNLRNDSVLYGIDAISKKLRSDLLVSVVDAITIDVGVVVVGIIKSGVVRINDLLHLKKGELIISAKVAGIEIGSQLCKEGYFGETVGLLFKDKSIAVITEGDSLIRPS